MMTNNEIQRLGFRAVIEHEKNAGRHAKKVKASGYDIKSTGDNKARHIEVKATSKEKPSLRFMTKNEFELMLKDPFFFLYIITSVADSPIIHEFRRKDILKRLKGIEIRYRIGFTAKDFNAEAGEKPYRAQQN